MGETRWLGEEEQRTWRAFLWTSRLLHEALDRQLQHDAGMPHTYYMILAMLSEAPQRAMRMSELAALLRFSQSRLSHAVGRLEEAGLVRRKRCPTDRRGNVAVLTDTGYAALAEAAPGHVEAVRQNLFDQLTPDQVTQLRGVCEAALAKLDPDGTLARRTRGSAA